MTEHQVASFDGCIHALKQQNLRQALYDEAGLLMEHALVNLHGAEHRTRRNIEGTVFRKEVFFNYEKNILPGVLEAAIAPFREKGEGDLVDIGYRILMNLTADFAGIDRPTRSVEETDELVRMMKEFSLAPALGQSLPDVVEEKKARIRKVMAEFDTRFLTPSLERRRQLLADRDAGRIADDDLPRDVLMTLVANAERAGMTDEKLLQEGIFYTLAGAHTTIHSLTHAVNELLLWLEAHPEDVQRLQDDPLFIQRCLFESVRLHPSSPVAKRRALAPIELKDGSTVAEGDTVVVNLRAANRTTDIFGDDADRFNPHREITGSYLPHGISMGFGMHACLGRKLAIGNEPRADTDPATHEYGIIAQIIRELVRSGIRRDPEKPAQKDETVTRITFAHYPVLFRPEEALLS